MRKTLIAVAALTAATVPTIPAASAKTPPAKTLKAQRVAADATWLGQADATTGAFRAPAGASAATLSSDRGAVAIVPAPEGCGVTAAGGGRLAYVCGPDSEPAPQAGVPTRTRHLAVTALDGQEVVRVDQQLPMGVEGAWPGLPVAVGAQWVRTLSGGTKGFAYYDVNWRTGEQRGGDLRDPAKRFDLDAPGLESALCAPLRATPNPLSGNGSGGEPALLPVTVRGSWVVTVTRPFMQAPDGNHELSERAVLRRCGSAKPVALPSVFTDPVLGDGWVGQVVGPRGKGRRLELLRLADRRRFTVPRADGQLTFTRGRAYLHAGAGRTGAIARVALPGR